MNKETYLTEYPKHESMRENVKKDKNRLHFHMMPPSILGPLSCAEIKLPSE